MNDAKILCNVCLWDIARWIDLRTTGQTSTMGEQFKQGARRADIAVGIQCQYSGYPFILLALELGGEVFDAIKQHFPLVIANSHILRIVGESHISYSAERCRGRGPIREHSHTTSVHLSHASQFDSVRRAAR